MSYLQLCLQYYLRDEIINNSICIIKGFNNQINPTALYLFNPVSYYIYLLIQIEFGSIISGIHINIDIKDLKENTKYTYYTTEDRWVIWFWEVYILQ